MKKQDKWDKLLSLLGKEDFVIDDFLACIAANLLRQDGNEYKTSMIVGGKFFEIIIKKRGLM